MKKVLKIIFLFIFLVIFILLLINFSGLSLYNKKSISQVDILSSNDSYFVAETISTSNSIQFSFTPKINQVKDYLLSYELKENNQILDLVDKKIVNNISQHNPILLNISRSLDSKYSLKTIIFDVENPVIELHNDQIIIHPQEIKD